MVSNVSFRIVYIARGILGNCISNSVAAIYDLLFSIPLDAVGHLLRILKTAFKSARVRDTRNSVYTFFRACLARFQTCPAVVGLAERRGGKKEEGEEGKKGIR